MESQEEKITKLFLQRNEYIYPIDLTSFLFSHIHLLELKVELKKKKFNMRRNISTDVRKPNIVLLTLTL